jgi:hypothetical protein
MKTYTIRIIETLSREVEVTASSAEMAEKMVKRMYRDEDITLDSGDFDFVDFMNTNEQEE